MNRRRRTAMAAIALIGMAQSASADVIVDRNMKAVTVVPDSELELLGVSVDHKTWEAPDGTIYRCDGGFYAIKIKGQGTIWCNGQEL